MSGSMREWRHFATFPLWRPRVRSWWRQGPWDALEASRRARTLDAGVRHCAWEGDTHLGEEREEHQVEDEHDQVRVACLRRERIQNRVDRLGARARRRTQHGQAGPGHEREQPARELPAQLGLLLRRRVRRALRRPTAGEQRVTRRLEGGEQRIGGEGVCIEQVREKA